MPIYEYRCQACGHEMEKLQKLSDAPLLDCPACGKSALVKLVSAAGFRLKGAGWYETDFKKDGKRNLAGESDKAGKEGAKDAAGSDKSGDKKPEAKAEKQKPKPSGEKAA
ncbi:MAG: zinc ribbon domain-containing protein [Wenzhouxiangella sp.]|nr:MAG: zinc ribbon domain-containing protein [Wenzhouxiangella sp.]